MAASVFTAASAATGRDLEQLCFETDEDTLRQTQNAQLALYACGLAGYKALQEMYSVAPAAYAGHSVGEYAALAAAGVISVEDGARLVQRRGELMAASGKDRAGTMAAVIGLEREALESVCQDASTDESVVVIANDNCPGQLVISGDVAAVERAGALASERGARRVLPLNVSGAFHSPLMQEASEMMGQALREVKFQTGEAPVFANVTASPVADPSEWPGLLEQQLRSPVRWTESIRAMRQAGIDRFIECGGGEVLGGLIRRIDKEASTFAVQDKISLDEFQA